MEAVLSLDRFCRSGNAMDLNDVANLSRIHSKIPSSMATLRFAAE